MRLPRKSAIEKSKRCSEERLIHASGGELLYLSNSDAVPAGLGMAGIIEAPDGTKDTRCDPPHPRWWGPWDDCGAPGRPRFRLFSEDNDHFRGVPLPPPPCDWNHRVTRSSDANILIPDGLRGKCSEIRT